MKQFIKGFNYVLQGMVWISRPRIRRFIYVPVLVNVVLFALAIGILGKYLPFWVVSLLGQKSDWWGIFQWLYDFLIPILTFIVYIAMLFVVYFGFSSVANLIVAPFNALLAKAVEQRLAGQTITYNEVPLLKEILPTIKSELAKIIRFIVLASGLLLLLLIPGGNALFPFLWFIFMAYTLSLQYVDFPMANHLLYYSEQKKVLKKHRAERLGFGTAANILLLIPVVNFIAMPVCVCGATVWWYQSLRHSDEFKTKKSRL